MFSVVIPIYNHATWFPDAVVSALRSPLVLEVLLVDDGSTDGSAAQAARLAAAFPGRVRNLTSGSENRGAALRLNQLVGESDCEWVAVLNSDDRFVAGRFSMLQGWLRNAVVDFVCGHLVIMNESGTPVGTKRGVEEPEYPFPRDLDVRLLVRRGELLPLLANQNFIATTSNMVFRRSLWERVGGFRDYRFVHDWDFGLRAAAFGRTLYLPHFLSSYRTHRGNTIQADKGRVAKETQAMFGRLLDEQPALRVRRGVEAGLRENRYLVAESSD